MNESKCRKVVSERAGDYCERCGVHSSSRGLTLHHRVKRSQGGKWEPQNCVKLCGHGTAGCHGWVEHNPNDAEAQGFHVRPWNTPADIPVLRRGLWVQLNDGGDYTPVERVPAPQEAR